MQLHFLDKKASASSTPPASVSQKHSTDHVHDSGSNNICCAENDNMLCSHNVMSNIPDVELRSYSTSLGHDLIKHTEASPVTKERQVTQQPTLMLDDSVKLSEHIQTNELSIDLYMNI